MSSTDGATAAPEIQFEKIVLSGLVSKENNAADTFIFSNIFAKVPYPLCNLFWAPAFCLNHVHVVFVLGTFTYLEYLDSDDCYDRQPTVRQATISES
jgi:hypothetical protein